MSYKAWMTFRSEPPATNALVFATRDEAYQYGADLFSRWTMPEGFEIRESEEPVNYRWVTGEGAQRLDPETGEAVGEPVQLPARVQL